VAASRESAQLLDGKDPLAPVRQRFLLPEGVVYLDGNSLGALPRGVPERVRDAIGEEWGRLLIRAWNDADWWGAPLRTGDRIGGLLGAAPGQVTVGESTSVQIFNALGAAARLRPGRRLLVTDPEHFPTDRYLAASVARLLGLEVADVAVPALPEFLRRRGADVAVVAFGAVDYRSGELWDVRSVTAAAHGAGAVAVWDLCHAVGAVPLAVDADGVDLAVGCTYKFLCGGPGAPAFIYVAERHQAAFDHPLTGWHGHARPFGMTPDFEPAPGISRARIGTPHVLSLLALEKALDVFDGVEMPDVRAKSLALGAFFLECADTLLAGLGFRAATPREEHRRGSQVSLAHPQARAMMAALGERGIIGDVRPPDLLRFGFNALYTSYTDVFDAVAALREVTVEEEYRHPRFSVRRPVS
jgi:kynureninase